MNFITRLFSTDRSFSSYEECPELYYRFNGHGEYGPQKLDVVLNYESIKPGGTVECRFADEKSWRPKAYFEDLWHKIPPSQHSLTRLRKEGVEIKAGLSEAEARAMIRDIQKAKQATEGQIKKLRDAGVDSPASLERGQAKAKIREIELAKREKDEQRRKDDKRLGDVPKVAVANERLASLVLQVRSLWPEWTPREIEDLEPLENYVRVVEEALQYAHGFDGGALNSDIFNDPSKDNSGYYLTFEGRVDPEELRKFERQIFARYLENGGDRFDHLTPLKNSFTNLEVEGL